MKPFGVLRFPGTNCDADVFSMVRDLGKKPEYLWHADFFEPQRFDALIIPGGFSYGDHLRCGALASHSSAMKSLREAVKMGVPVLGICNGFQILCEAHLLPGALLKNQSGLFIDAWVDLEVQDKSYWSNSNQNKILKLPIAHGEGRFFCTDEELKRLKDKGQIWLKYRSNPNGSIDDIAGVMSEDGKLAGLMPHPERALFDWMGSVDGRGFL